MLKQKTKCWDILCDIDTGKIIQSEALSTKKQGQK